MTDVLHTERRLRREHWRWQRYGPGRTLRKRIRIAETRVPVRVRKKINYELPF